MKAAGLQSIRWEIGDDHHGSHTCTAPPAAADIAAVQASARRLRARSKSATQMVMFSAFHPRPLRKAAA